MDDQIRRALLQDRLIDITTTGRASGQPRRKEIWFHNLDGAVYITGIPGRRDWYANLIANPAFTFHLKQSVSADLNARAVPVSDTNARRSILSVILRRLDREAELKRWVAESPLVAVEFKDPQ